MSNVNTAFAFDLDGTVTSQELLPLIAGELDLTHEMSVLTDLTLSGSIPFEESFRLRCAILRSVPISRVQEIVAEVTMDSHIERFIKENADRSFIVTGNLDVWVRPLVERLGCEAFTSTAICDGDQLRRVGDVMHKSRPAYILRRRFDRLVGIGESVNDIPMFEVADIGVAFGGVHPPAPELVRVADYVTFEGESLCRLLTTL